MFRFLTSRAAWPAWGLLLIGLVTTGLVSHALRRDVDRHIERDFSAHGAAVSRLLQDRLTARTQALQAAAAALATGLDRAGWHQYVRALQLPRTLPGVLAIGFSIVLTPAELDRHVAQVRAEGFPAYTLFPPGQRPLYSSLVYIEPADGPGRQALGYDMYSKPSRRGAMDLARDSGQVALTGPLTPIPDLGVDAPTTVLMFAPVYRPGLPTNTPAERQAALLGWAVGAGDARALVAALLADLPLPLDEATAVSVHDRTVPHDAALLYAAPAQPAGPLPYALHYPLDVGGRHWELTLQRATLAAAGDYRAYWRGAIAGTLLSVLLFAVTVLRIRGQQQALENAIAMQTALRERERQATENNQLLNLALEGAGVGIWDYRPAERRVIFSPHWREVVGLPPSAPLDEPVDAWLARIHPDDRAATEAAIETLQNQSAQQFRHEYRLRRAEDGYFPVEARGAVVERDAAGRPLRLIGLSLDVSELRRAQQHAETRSRLYAALSACNAAIAHCRDQRQLFADVCRTVVELGGLTMAWIGLLDPASGRIVPAASAGTGTDYLDGIEISVSADDPHGHGPTGTAVRENRPVWVSDFASNPLTAPWHRRAAPYGWTAAAALPLCRRGQAIGALTIYTVDLDLQDPDLQQLMAEMASNICFALDKLAAEDAARAHQATLLEAEQRFSALIEQSIAGAFIVQNDRFTYVNPRLCTMFGYQDPSDLLGRSPRQLVAAKDLGRVTEQLAGVLAGQLLHRHMLLTALRADGSPLEVAIDFALTHYQQRPAVVGLVQDLTDREVAAQHIRRYTAQLENVFRQTVRLVTLLVERRDPYTAGHEQRVARLAVAIGTEMGLAGGVLQGLDVGGQLHDVGKMQVPVEILTKPGRLTDAEYALIKDHAQAGYDILKDVDFPWPVALIAAQHHERPDGSGYPRGLKGDQIILEARIVAVADVVEAMALHRPYRFSEGLDVALQEIERGRGSAYDAEVVDACLRLFRQKGYALDGAGNGDDGSAQAALPAPAQDLATDS